MHGALAQLGARNIRIVEAVGSNPICSIIAQISEPVLLPEGFGNFLFYAAYILPRLKSPCWAATLKYDKICVF